MELETRDFDNKEDAVRFAKEHCGFYEEFIIDYELNASWTVFYPPERAENLSKVFTR